MEIKKNVPSNTVTRKLVDLDTPTGNIYESINIIARRANQIATELKTELNRKLADFSAPKIPRNSARFESKNFYKADFWLCKAQNAVNPFGFTSILTQNERKFAFLKRCSDY